VTARDFLGSTRLTQALTELIVGTALAMHAVRALVGWPGAIAVLVVLVALSMVSLWSQPHRVEWRGVLPISLTALFGLFGASIIWSQYGWVSVGAIAYAFTFGVLGLYIALVRDLIQLVRAVGNVLRVILAVSFALEILSGAILDAPFEWINISGALAVGGPVEGIAGTRNAFAFIGALALLSFWIELRTRSVSRLVSFVSIVFAASAILLARSPVSILVLGVVVVFSLALVGLRRLEPTARRATQSALLVSAVVLAVIAWSFRWTLIAVVDAAADVESRTLVWQQLRQLVDQQPVLGWGWAGAWPPDIYPFVIINGGQGSPPPSALNAYVDVWLQLGLVGVIVFVTALSLAFVRAWLVAAERGSTVYVWPALTLTLLATWSFTESYVLFEGGLLLFVTSAFAAARNRSWRSRLGTTRP
jgi:O-antigen ligase